MPRTYPAYHDALFVSDILSRAKRQQLKDLSANSLVDSVASQLEGTGPTEAATAAGQAFSAINPNLQGVVAATSPVAIPGTSRRLLGLLPPRIPVPAPFHSSTMAIGAKDRHGEGVATERMTAYPKGELDPALVSKLEQLAYLHNQKRLKNLSSFIQPPSDEGATFRDIPAVVAKKGHTVFAHQPTKPEATVKNPLTNSPMTKAGSAELSFEWAKTGSWEQYEQELDRAMSVRKSAEKGWMFDTPDKGWLDTAKQWGGNLHQNLTGGMTRMGISQPWHNPLIGAGIGAGVGALGGLLTDKRKGRGMLQGALLGGGLGALGGLGYDQYGNSALKQQAAADELKKYQENKATTAGGPAAGGGSAASSAWESVPGWLRGSIAPAFEISGGQLLANSGRRVTQIAGAAAPVNPHGWKTTMTAPPNEASLRQLTEPAALQAALTTLRQQESSVPITRFGGADPSRLNTDMMQPTADEMLHNTTQIQRRLAGGPKAWQADMVSPAGATMTMGIDPQNKTINRVVTEPELINAHTQNLSVLHNQGQPLPNDALTRRNNLEKRLLGNALTVGGVGHGLWNLGTGLYDMTFGKDTNPLHSQLAGFKPEMANSAWVIEQMLRSQPNPVQALDGFVASNPNLGWSPAFIAAIRNRLSGR